MSSSLDVERLLEPISGEEPAGADLHYDPAFLELERLAVGSPERNVSGKTVEAVKPDWAAIFEGAPDFLARSKDLRVAVMLANAATRIEGLPGLDAGMHIVRELLERYWAGLHPLLDAEDDDDPTERISALLPLQDYDGMLESIRRTTLVDVPIHGRFCYRDYLIASGELSTGTDGAEPPQMSDIDSAFSAADTEALTATLECIENSVDNADLIEAFVDDKIKGGSSLDLEPLRDCLRKIGSLIQSQLAMRGVGGISEEIPAASSDAGSSAVAGVIRSRDDAVRMLDRVCEYFQRHEPSSPVPLLLRRAQDWANMEFLDILADMTPQGLEQAKTIAGIRGDD